MALTAGAFNAIILTRQGAFDGKASFQDRMLNRTHGDNATISIIKAAQVIMKFCAGCNFQNVSS